MAKKKVTPMMEQYLAVKKQYPDAFLFYRLGDFYEMFYDDAIKGSQLLELTLTQRNKNSLEPIPMCGVPHHAAKNYIDILVDKGYKVAICEQMEDPKQAQGMVKREVVQLVTPGTIMDEGASQAKSNNYLTALHEQAGQLGFAYVDLSTGELKSTVVNNLASLQNEILSLHTKEIVVDQSLSAQTKELLAKLKILSSHQDDYQAQAEFSFISQDLHEASEIEAVMHLLMYLKVTQKRALAHLQKAVHYEPANYLKLDHYAKRNLELLVNSRTNKKSGTLLWLLDATKTAMGGRLLKQWLERPLLNQAEIEARLELVAILKDNFFERSSLQESLSKVYDLERLAGRVAFGNVNGRDLLQLKTSLIEVPQIRYVLEQLAGKQFAGLLAKLDPLEEVVDLIDRAIVDEPPISVTDGNLIKAGYDPKLDEYQDAMKNGKLWLAKLEASERELTGIHNLKIGFNRVFGYYIEVTKANLAKLPKDRYQRKQTLTNAERFITPELKEKEDLILGAESKAYELEYQLFVAVRDQIKDQIKRLQSLAQALAKLDVLQSFAVVSEDAHLVRPTFTSDKSLVIKDGFHPVVEKVVGRQSYVPNDIIMSPTKQILLVTGPNMSGKSTYMRQLALTVIMAQIGCFVPASQAALPIFDQIFTRIGAADDLISGESTFMVEMKEANEALQNASENSLLLFDEIGRGTATYDGMALAQAIIEYVHDKVKAKTVFSTHYHELTDLEQTLAHLENIHVGAVEKDGQLVFLHKVEAGPADKSYGIHVAKLAGMPSELLTRADKILTKLEANKQDQVSPAAKPEELIKEEGQLSLFAEETPVEPKAKPVSKQADKVLKELGQLNLMALTPMEVMNAVYKWQQELE